VFLVDGGAALSDLVPESDARAERRRQILDAAVRVFAEKGHEAIRIQDVADQAGVAYGLVYHYFGTKDALLKTVFDENWAIFAEVVDRITSSDRSPEDAVRAVLDYAFGALDAFPDRMKVILLEYGRHARLGGALSHPDVARVVACLERTFVASAEQGALVPDANPRALAVLFLGALEGAIVATLAAPRAAPTEPPDLSAVRATVLALFRGVTARPPST
jgi:TetR/AcrR family fatty acid metabolism transcriptional regulator